MVGLKLQSSLPRKWDLPSLQIGLLHYIGKCREMLRVLSVEDEASLLVDDLGIPLNSCCKDHRNMGKFQECHYGGYIWSWAPFLQHSKGSGDARSEAGNRRASASASHPRHRMLTGGIECRLLRLPICTWWSLKFISWGFLQHLRAGTSFLHFFLFQRACDTYN